MEYYDYDKIPGELFLYDMVSEDEYGIIQYR